MSLINKLEEGNEFLIYDRVEDVPVILLASPKYWNFQKDDEMVAVWDRLVKIDPNLEVLSVPEAIPLLKLHKDTAAKKRFAHKTLVYHGYREGTTYEEIDEEEEEEGETETTSGDEDYNRLQVQEETTAKVDKDGAAIAIVFVVLTLLMAFSIELLQSSQRLPDQRYHAGEYCLCILKKRIAFLDTNGYPQRSPTHANAIIYLPNRDTKQFETSFRPIGTILNTA